MRLHVVSTTVPRRRGDEPLSPPCWNRSPAGAGMNRGSQSGECAHRLDPCVPRRRGDEPAMNRPLRGSRLVPRRRGDEPTIGSICQGSVPRRRGDEPLPSCLMHGQTSFPAGAGMNRSIDPGSMIKDPFPAGAGMNRIGICRVPFPAGAGMNRGRTGVPEESVPRRRGDEPDIRKRRHVAAVTPFPAGAGMNREPTSG